MYAVLRVIFGTISIMVGIIILGILMQGRNYFLVARKYGEVGPWRDVVKRKMITALKCMKLLCYPLAPSAGITVWWKWFLYDPGINLHHEFEAIATAGWIAGTAAIYALFTAPVLQEARDKYWDIRRATRRIDGQEEFFELIDEEVSPVTYTLVGVLSLFFLGGFLVIQYPTVVCGYIAIGSIAYVLSLIFFVIREVDSPCKGSFVIKSIPEGWDEVHAKEYRKLRNAKARQDFIERLAKMGDTVRLPRQENRGGAIFGLAIFRKRRHQD